MLAHWEQSRAQLAIGHQGQFPSTVISFNLAPGKALGDAVNAVNRIEQRIQLPKAINASFQGTAAAFQTSLANEPILILAALVTVSRIVLGVLCKELHSPHHHHLSRCLPPSVTSAPSARPDASPEQRVLRHRA